MQDWISALHLPGKLMDTALFSVVYPGMEAYFPDFLQSLSRQTNNNFSLFLINDGLSSIERFLNKVDLDVKVKNVKGSPAALRKMGIKWVQEAGAKRIVFADSDDYFAGNRVEISNALLDQYDLTFNELILTGKKDTDGTRVINNNFSEGEYITSKHIRTNNCLGLSNTALRVKSIPQTIDRIPEHIIAFDWTFFALCLHTGAKGVYTQKTVTYYRQVDASLATPFSFTEQQILRGVQVKKVHYQILSRLYSEYDTLLNVFKKLLAQLKSDAVLRQKYCRAVQKHAPAIPLWWEAIKPLEEVGL